MRTVDGGCCAAKGFKAAGIHCGIRKNQEKKDLCLIVAEQACASAAVYTLNKVKASPIEVTMAHLKNHTARVILANSGNANACAPNGIENAVRSCRACAKELGIDENEIIVNSTGVIGVSLPVEAIENAMPKLISSLSEKGNDAAADAIMTTDLAQKQAAVQVQIGGKTVTVGGIAKGSGMIHPNMGTMLSFLTTDCNITPKLLQEALNESVRRTYNRISVDGDTSTNDMAAVLASGLAGNKCIDSKNEDYTMFCDCLDAVNLDLARKIARDGEGATHLVTCKVAGAVNEQAAELLAKSVIASSLVKAAMFGADANWGRVLCAMGYSGAEFSTDSVKISFASSSGSVLVCESGEGVVFDETYAKKILSEEEVSIICELRDGEAEAEAYGCDLTYDYVKINGDYRT